MDIKLTISAETLRAISYNCQFTGDMQTLVHLVAALNDDRIGLMVLLGGVSTDHIYRLLRHFADRATPSQCANLLAVVPPKILARISMQLADDGLDKLRKMICSTREFARAALWYAIEHGFEGEMRHLMCYSDDVPRWFPDIHDWMFFSPKLSTTAELRDFEKRVDKVIVCDAMRIVIPRAMNLAAKDQHAWRKQYAENPIIKVFTERNLATLITRLACGTMALI